MKRFNMKPFYNDDADYTTNAPTYYDSLGRLNKLIKLLAKRVWEYDKVLFESLEEVERVLAEVINKIGEGFNEEIYELLIKWVEDGTLDHIINVTLMNKKADITYVDELHEEIKRIMTEKFQDVEESFSNVDKRITEFETTVEEFAEEVQEKFIAINKNLAEVINDLDTFRTVTNNKFNEVNKHVPVNHYNSDAYNSLQDAIYAAEGGVLHVKPDTYLIDRPIKIRSNTIIMAYGSTFRRNANINNMFINDSDGTKGLYSANNNIHIYGGTFDGAGGSFVDECSILAFGHCEDIIIEDCRFKNLVNWHMIELNAVRNAVIENCRFDDYGGDGIGSEMVQIDLAKGTNQFPWFAPYDDTTCDNIMIVNNVFKNGVRGVGTHSSTVNKEHTKITIKDNEFSNMRKEAIYGMDWAFTKIHSNHFYNVFKGVHLTVLGRIVQNHSINDNYMYGQNDGESRGIQITGIQNGYEIRGGTIKDNKIKHFGGHGIGVDYSSTWLIDGNDVTACGKTGIILYGSSYCIVSNNISRLNNTAGGSVNTDMSARNTTTNTVVIGNILGTILLEGTSAKGVNNMVGGTMQ